MISQPLWPLAYAYLIFPLAAKLSMIAPGHHSFLASIGQLPLPLRVILYFVLADLGHYWVHRLIHKWHHSPTYMYWLGGVRATLPQQSFVNIPYVIAHPLLDISPWYMAITLGTISTIQNDAIRCPHQEDAKQVRSGPVPPLAKG
jgi:sterol desaturase/sphingolipid hydroxylase (fatty acid hydroxylase superfamily)